MSCWISVPPSVWGRILGLETFLSYWVQDLATVDTILLNRLPAAEDKASVSEATFYYDI